MRTKKYWEKLCEEKHSIIQKHEEALNEKDKALRFLMADSNPYRVEVKQLGGLFGDYREYIDFEYVDESGVFHSTRRKMLAEKLTCISTSKEAAVFSYSATIPTSYWILQKAAEVFAEIPESFLCHRGEKICEIKEIENDCSADS